MIEMNSDNSIQRVTDRRFPLIYFLSKYSKLNLILVIIPAIYMLFLILIPLLDLFKMALFDESGFTFQYVKDVLTNSVYLKILYLTLKVCLLVTFASLIFSYPIAYLLVKMKSSVWKKVVFACILIPFWISLLIRTFAWSVILQDQGIINKLLMSLHIISEPLPLLFNTTGVVIGMTHILMPYMILSLYTVMQGIDRNLLLAAEGLGASPSKSFFDIFFPLSLPGIVAGSLIVFVMSLGFYITPALLGSANNMVVAMLIENNINVTLNWHLASAVSIIVLLFTLLIIFLPFFFLRKHPLIKEVI